MKGIRSNTISNIVKDFVSAELSEQKDILTLLLLADQENQYLAYLIYDMISNESGLLKPQPLSERIFDNLHWNVQKLFKMKSEVLEKKNKKLQALKEDDLPYENKIMLMNADDSIKAKALDKLKEINSKGLLGGGEGSSKAQHYLDGLLKVPFGIHKQEEIFTSLNDIRKNVITFHRKYLRALKVIYDESEIRESKDHKLMISYIEDNFNSVNINKYLLLVGSLYFFDLKFMEKIVKGLDYITLQNLFKHLKKKNNESKENLIRRNGEANETKRSKIL